ncbi:JNK1/MAPK8-associated membrane protein [Daktulosphaira vitifoliae]|uniref:JNK1/MAPK8-associated membrane protein n=1 Tax=Daktulosphaira vitifoliae TaxID=58002 RepID=UPI0021AA8591|nr:JNK1/MAPK8-associated membrane protein [Daktulosphaira vitifoliae]
MGDYYNLISKNHNSIDDLIDPRCPGYYCGRRLLANGRTSDCGSCPTGTRVNAFHMCQPCTDTPSSYDWMYLLFMAVVPLLFHAVYIDLSSISWASQVKSDNSRNKTKTKIVLYISATLEVITAATLAVLAVDPLGQISIRSCRTQWLSDWYTVLYNPTPDYHEPLRCTQEAVYPMYSMIFIFYLGCVITLLTFRPIFSAYFNLSGSLYLKTLYAGLYFFPIAAVTHAFLGGIIYMTFPYIVIVLSVVSSAIHFATEINQSTRYLIVNTVCVPRNILIVAIHWISHGFGIVAITQLANPPVDYALLLLVPLPTVFYIATTRISEPSKILVL